MHVVLVLCGCLGFRASSMTSDAPLCKVRTIHLDDMSNVWTLEESMGLSWRENEAIKKPSPENGRRP